METNTSKAKSEARRVTSSSQGASSSNGNGTAQRLKTTQEQLRAVEQALSESEARFKATFHQSPVATVITTTDGHFLDVNRAFLHLTGYARPDLIGEAAADLGFSFLEGDAEGAWPFVESIASDHGEHQIHTQEGAPRITLISPREIDLHGQPCTLTMFHDITERRRLEREMLDTSEQLLRRIGNDLHDELGQNLVAAAYRTDALAETLAGRQLNAQATEARHLADTIRESLEHVRKLSRQLSPLNVERGNLVEVLEQLSERTERVFGLPCRLTTEDVTLAEDRGVVLHLYRIAQEAVTNAVKHAEASEVIISLSVEGDENVLRVRDDGVGVDLDHLDASEGQGLRIMLYRTDVIGGTLHVEADGTAGGTTIECRLPR